MYTYVGFDDKLDSTKLRKEKLRYQINWIFLVLLGMLDGVNYTAMTTTFHQYVINPRSESLGNQSEVHILYIFKQYEVVVMVVVVGDGA